MLETGGKRPLLFATSKAVPDAQPWDVDLPEQLAKLGQPNSCAVWDDPNVAWADAAGVVVRSTWDYTTRLQEFLAWARRVEAQGTPLWNPAATLKWNSNKRYLKELAAQGLSVVPTEWLAKGSRRTLEEVASAHGWKEVVAKPAVSAGARQTRRLSAPFGPQESAWFADLSAKVDTLVQPFVPAITTEGEWAFLFFGGQFSHAVLKRPRAGDYRVQSAHGGVAARGNPSPTEVAQAQAFVDARPGTLYARVDLVRHEGRLHLMELELIEPHLYMGEAPGASQRFAQAIARAVA